MWVRTPGHSSRGLVSIARVEVSPFLSGIENNSFAEVACKRDLRAVEVISAGGNYDSATNFKRLGKYIIHILNGPEEKLRRILEDRIPGKLSLPSRESPCAVGEVFYLRLKLHLLYVRNKLRSWLVSQLAKILMNGIALDKTNFGVEPRANVFIDGNEAIKVILKDRF